MGVGSFNLTIAYTMVFFCVFLEHYIIFVTTEKQENSCQILDLAEVLLFFGGIN